MKRVVKCDWKPYLAAFRRGFAEAVALAPKMWPKKKR